jgi:mannose-6-phosphate isomerase-like protein (cupin superfamily)
MAPEETRGGATVRDPSRRQVYGFRRAGDHLLIDVIVDPGGDQPLHLHPALEERFEILEGRFRFVVGRSRMFLSRGDELVVPPGVRHAFTYVGDEQGSLRVEVRPAGELRAMLEDLAEVAREGELTRRGLPTSPRAALQIAKLLERHRSTTVVCRPLGARRVLPAVARLAEQTCPSTPSGAPT